VSFREDDGSWGKAVPLGEILGERTATIPSVSPDGQYLFYTSHDDVHWVSTEILGKLRRQKAAPGFSALTQDVFDAVRNGDLAKVKTLVERDPSLLNARNARQSTPLHLAVDSDRVPLARYLIETGADVNAVNHINWTPLFYIKGIEMAALLLDKGPISISSRRHHSAGADCLYRETRARGLSPLQERKNPRAENAPRFADGDPGPEDGESALFRRGLAAGS
jgi:ankyrin repeat protein